MKNIDIGSAGGKAFALPLEAVTQTIAILAKRGVGKSYTASVMAEGMLAAGQQVVILDPTGAWWGLKSSASGKEPGYQVTVFGGDHADLPLQENVGELIAPEGTGPAVRHGVPRDALPAEPRSAPPDRG